MHSPNGEILRETEILQRVFDHIPVMINFIDRDNRIVLVNREWERVLGWSLAEVQQHNIDVFEVCYPDPDYRAQVVRFITESNGAWANFKTTVKDGRVVDTAWAVVHLSDGTYMGFGRDLTEQNAVGAALQSSEGELRALFAAMTDVILELDRDGRYVKIAPTNPMYLYKPPLELVGNTLHEVLPPQDADFFLEHVQRALAEGRMHRVEYHLPIHGVDTWFEGSVSPRSDDTVLWIARDITERRQSREALRRSEERYRMLFESNPSPLYVIDFGTLRFVAVNEAAIRHYGYAREEFLGMQLTDLRPDLDVPQLLTTLAEWSGDTYTGGPWRHRRKDGSTILAEVTSHKVTFDGRPAILVLANDVTLRHQLEDQLRHAQKMEAIGLLAGGVAHDFNNLLTAILGHSDLAMRSLPCGDTLRPDLEQIRRAGERAAGLTRQLLTFSRKQVVQLRVLDVNEVVSDMGKMLRRVIGEDVALHTALDPVAARVKADPGQLEQVLMNLAVNARDAMPDGGRLEIATHHVDVDEAAARLLVDLAPGPYVLLTVRDFGIGMDGETLKRIFEPFFTTKPAGHGTGLGLSTVYGIVRQFGGAIRVESEVGKGTTIFIYLPFVAGPATSAAHALEAVEARGSGETILLTEDEEMVRKLTRAVLEARGYRVLEATNGVEALEVGRSHAGPIDLLLSDVIMPGMNGRELGERLIAQRPGIRVLFMSGYTADAMAGRVAADFPLLAKPFSPPALVQKVREVLDSA